MFGDIAFQASGDTSYNRHVNFHHIASGLMVLFRYEEFDNKCGLEIETTFG